MSKDEAEYRARIEKEGWQRLPSPPLAFQFRVVVYWETCSIVRWKVGVIQNEMIINRMREWPFEVLT